MKTPRYTDKHRGARYRTADESARPGYLARRFRAIRRLQRMQARKSSVTKLPTQRKAIHG